MVLLFLAGCATSLEEQYDRAYACKESLVLDESGETRKRTTEEIDRDCGFDKYLKRLDREQFEPRPIVCPENYIVMCQGFSCGRPPTRERDYRDYSCVSRGEFRRLFGG